MSPAHVKAICTADASCTAAEPLVGISVLDGVLDVPPVGIPLHIRLSHRLATVSSRRWFPMQNQRPIVSFTFDDIARSACVEGARVLEDEGVRGTFYIASSLIGQTCGLWDMADFDDIEHLHRRGHELGLHSHTHDFVADMGRKAFTCDLRENRDILSDLPGQPIIENYAFPYGFSSLRQAQQLKRRVRSSRTAHPGINVRRLDPFFLLSHMLGQTVVTNDVVQRLISATERDNGWLIFSTHDVTSQPSPYGCHQDLLRFAVVSARRRGFSILPISKALDAVGLSPLREADHVW